MRSNRPPIHSVRWLTLVATVAVCGCNEYINPWTDEMIPQEYVTTTSVESARAATEPALAASRSFQPTHANPQDGTVGHFPLWFEDPFEDRGSDDGQFAMTAEDYFAMPYGLSRFLLNWMFVPVSAVVQAPVPLMGSDGITSRQFLGLDHDSEWLPAGRSSTPPDVLEIGSIPSGSIHSHSGEVEPGA